VQRASAVLRGTASEPDLDLKVTVDERADLPGLLTAIDHRVASDLGAALDTQLRRLGVQVEVAKASSRNKNHQIILEG
jgi:hypothetical protein